MRASSDHSPKATRRRYSGQFPDVRGRHGSGLRACKHSVSFCRLITEPQNGSALVILSSRSRPIQWVPSTVSVSLPTTSTHGFLVRRNP